MNIQAAATASKTSPDQNGDFKESSEMLLNCIIKSLSENKAEDITTIDLRGRTSIGDYMVVASGRSTRQVSSISQKLVDILKTELGRISKVEGKDAGDWVLIDTGDVKQLKIKEIQSISERILDAEQNSQKLQNDLLSIKVADGNVDDLLAIEELRTAKEISAIQDSLSANESNIQSLSLIYTSKHPKLVKANEFHEKLKSQLEEKINISIQQKAFELGNMDNFIKLSEDELKKSTDELRIIEEKESGMMKFAREVESSKKLYESFLQRVKETNEAQNLQVSKLKIIETPNLPSSPFTPNPSKNFILSLFLSFIGFYSLVFYKEMNSSVVKKSTSI